MKYFPPHVDMTTYDAEFEAKLRETFETAASEGNLLHGNDPEEIAAMEFLQKAQVEHPEKFLDAYRRLSASARGSVRILFNIDTPDPEVDALDENL